MSAETDRGPATAAAPPPASRGRLMRLATNASLALAIILLLAKLAAFLVTDSMAMLSAVVDSLLDTVASVVNLLAVRHALQPADREHRFGHGKAESLAGLGQAAFIGGSAAFLIVEACRRLLNPVPIENSAFGIAVIVVTIATTFALVRLQAYVVRSTGSVAVAADELHYRGDLLLNGGVLLALVLGPWLGWPLIDPALAIVIALFILISAWQIMARSLNVLMDRELPDEDRARIRRICEARPEVIGVHDLRTRSAGTNIFVQLHLELDGAMSLQQANAIAHAVESDIQAAFPGAEVLVHEDPVVRARPPVHQETAA